jgi:hypothetical protein
VPDCRLLAETLASWGGAVVPARVHTDGSEWFKASIKGWPARASSDPSQWREDWFTWGGNWWVAVCPRVGGLVALDLDGPEAIAVFKDAWASGDLPWHGEELVYTTPGHGGGMHVWWRWPTTLAPFSRLVATLPAGGEVDLRGEAGFVLMCGAPRPDLLDGARYAMVQKPDPGGPPPAPPELRDWVMSLGPHVAEDAPVHQGKQLSPEGLARVAEQQGGRVTHDRHSTLFRVCSWLRVRRDFNTFETLATELWRLTETHFDTGAEGADHWQNECVRVARNARAYTEARDAAQAEAAQVSIAALGLGPPRR